MSTETTTSSGIGFLGLLTILFIALKLMHYIDWSWWWVLAPLWVPFAVFFGLLLIAGGVGLLTVFIRKD